MEWIQPVCQVDHTMEQSDFVFCKLTSCEAMALSRSEGNYLRQLIRTLDSQAFLQGNFCVWVITLSWAITDK